MSAQVALLFVVTGSGLTHVTGRSDPKPTVEESIRNVPHIDRAKFVASSLSTQCSTPEGVKKLRASLPDDRRLDTLRRALVVLEGTCQQLSRDDADTVASVVPAMLNEDVARRLIQALYSHEATTKVVEHVIGFNHPRVAIESLMPQWAELGVDTMTRIMTHLPVMEAVRSLATSTMLASSSDRHKAALPAFYQEHYQSLFAKAVSTRQGIARTQREHVQDLVRKATTIVDTDALLPILAACGVSMEPLVLQARRESSRVVNSLDPALHDVRRSIPAIAAAVAARHPHWRAAGVLDAESESTATESTTVSLVAQLARIYLRITGVPQAGSAVLANRFRRRIGPVGLGPTQHNVPVEVGFAEHYDNFEYKMWDRQGWYQRMVDIRHRNVSIRCRIKDLKTLTRQGVPFLSFQGERRLRVLAEDRVGTGVIKLDSDRYEDQSDNFEYGTLKLHQLISESKKVELGKEYWPTVEVKLRKLSGQTRMRYGMLDYDRVEGDSKAAYAAYRAAKSKAIFVTPFETWLKVEGTGKISGTTTKLTDTNGYSVENLFDQLK